VSKKPPTINEATCGTSSGYTIHHRRGESPCGPCLAARRDYDRRRWAVKRASVAIEDGVRVPAIDFAELYLAAPIELQDRLDKRLGTITIDALIKAYDAYIDSTQKDRAS